MGEYSPDNVHTYTHMNLLLRWMYGLYLFIVKHYMPNTCDSFWKKLITNKCVYNINIIYLDKLHTLGIGCFPFTLFL